MYLCRYYYGLEKRVVYKNSEDSTVAVRGIFFVNPFSRWALIVNHKNDSQIKVPDTTFVGLKKFPSYTNTVGPSLIDLYQML